MNTPIRRLFGVFVVMFAALLGATAWWTVVRADKLNRNYTSENKRDLLRGLKVRRGTIFAADGGVIARSRKDAQGIYSRSYPMNDVFGHPVGYSYASIDQSGVEAFYNHELSGGASATASFLEQLVGSRGEGDDLRTTLNPRVQRLADVAARPSSSIPARARSRSWPPCRAMTPTRSRSPRCSAA